MSHTTTKRKRTSLTGGTGGGWSAVAGAYIPSVQFNRKCQALPIELREKIALYAHPIHPCKYEINNKGYEERLFVRLPVGLRLRCFDGTDGEEDYFISYKPGYSNSRQIGMDFDGFYEFYLTNGCYYTTNIEVWEGVSPTTQVLQALRMSVVQPTRGLYPLLPTRILNKYYLIAIRKSFWRWEVARDGGIQVTGFSWSNF